MKPRRPIPTLRVAPIPRDYRPRYPRRLTLAEYRALIEPRLHPRMRRIAMLASHAGIVAGLAACDPDESTPTPPPQQRERPVAPADLEARVLARLCELRDRAGGGSWFAQSRFHRAAGTEASTGSPRWIARIPICYGNSYNGIFDVHLAREFAAAVFRDYGIEVAKDVPFRSGGASASLDGYDAPTGLGFELRDVERTSGVEMFGPSEFAVDAIDPARQLEDDEIPALAKAGFGIHVADPESRFDGDDFTGVITYLAGIVDFLNEHTDGPDIDVSAILWGERQHVRIRPTYSRSDEPHVNPDDRGAEDSWSRISIHRETTMTLAAEPASIESVSVEQPRETRSSAVDKIPNVLSTAGAPTVLILNVYREQGPVRRRLVQPEAADGKELVVEGTAAQLFLPSRFDAAKPFRIEVTLEPGNYTIWRDLLIGARKR